MRITRRARADLLAIRAWSEDQWGTARARDFLHGLIDALHRLDDFPEIGRPRRAFHPDLRSIRHKGYVIFYTIAGGRPVIVAVLHERRNHAALDFADRLEDL